MRAFRIGRRMQRVRADVAKAASHADAVGPHQLVIGEEFAIAVKSVGIARDRRQPFPFRRRVEIGIGKQPQTDDAGGAAVNAQEILAREILAIVRGEGAVLRAIGQVEPEAVAVGCRGLLEAGLVHQPVI